MALNATELRANLYRVLDRVAETGEPVEIIRKGRTLNIVVAGPKDKFKKLIKRDDYLKCDPDEIVHMDWSDQWRP
jgi:prevent-host-death family protein